MIKLISRFLCTAHNLQPNTSCLLRLQKAVVYFPLPASKTTSTHRSVDSSSSAPKCHKTFPTQRPFSDYFSIWAMQKCHLPATTPATYTKLILAAPCTISRGTPTKSWRTTLSPRCSILRQGKTTVVFFSKLFCLPSLPSRQRYLGKETNEHLLHGSRL